MIRTSAAARWEFIVLACFAVAAMAADESRAGVIEDVQPKVVKIYGAGGFKGLEAYQSGFLVSPDGFIITAWSYVLDTDPILVHLTDGRKFNGKLLGADPQLELAVVKIEGKDLPHFDLDDIVEADAGTRVLAFSNLYNVATGSEPLSVQHGVISVKSRLEARRGVFKTPYRGEVYVLDAVTNNPGAAGGALVNHRGQLLGMLGKELKNSLTNTWLNYSIPASAFREKAKDFISGDAFGIVQRSETEQPKAENPLSLSLLGLVLVPNVLERTPPFVDEVRPGSSAADAGLQPDDLVLFIADTRVANPRLIQSVKSLQEELGYIDRDDAIKLTVMRNDKLIEVELRAR